MKRIRRIPLYLGIGGALSYVFYVRTWPTLVWLLRQPESSTSGERILIGALWGMTFLVVIAGAYIAWWLLKHFGSVYDRLVMAPVFYRYFGAWPERGKRKPIVQTIVGQKLSLFAGTLHTAFEEENKILWMYPNDPLSALKEHRKAEKAVSKEKRKFWSRHGAAKLFGFEVSNSYMDYLLKP